jgi:hypothetical protein
MCRALFLTRPVPLRKYELSAVVALERVLNLLRIYGMSGLVGCSNHTSDRLELLDHIYTSIGQRRYCTGPPEKAFGSYPFVNERSLTLD